jgi:predicted ATPase
MITSVIVQNFKAIYKNPPLSIQPFSVFIGNNGTGKSSILEALRLLKTALDTDLATAFLEYGGLNRVRNYRAELPEEEMTMAGFRKKFEPIQIVIEAIINDRNYHYQVEINLNQSGDYYVVENEELHCGDLSLFVANITDNEGNGHTTFWNRDTGQGAEFNYKANRLLLGIPQQFFATGDFEIFQAFVQNWKFLYLNAHDMGKPVVQNRLNKEIELSYDGRNIADYLLWLRSQGQEYLDALIRKMLFVLPYVQDIQPNVVETYNREVELLLQEKSEQSQRLPGWLLSSGTLRILALLAMFETPKKPSVLFIDEIENGLDPRTIGLLINEIHNQFETREMQVIVTTHSPYFLDLVPLESIIVAEKQQEGSYYHLPKDEESLTLWRERFSPGKLYTMGKLTD